jgi:hypothetical protein
MTFLKLHKIEFNLLESIIESELFNKLNYTAEKYDYYIIDVSVDIIDELINQLSNKLMVDGFNPSFEPNSFGLQIEALIDKISEA